MVDAGKSINAAASLSGAMGALGLGKADSATLKEISGILSNAGKGESYSGDAQTVAAIGEHRGNPGALTEAIS